jgi:hypothetical protein
VLVVPGFDGLYLMNPSAAFIWQKLRLGVASDQIGLSLAEAYCIPTGRAHSDVLSAIQQWDACFDRQTGNPPSYRPTTCGRERETVTHYSWNGFHFTIELDSFELEAEIHPRLEKLLAPSSEPAFGFRLTTAEDAIHIHSGAEYIGTECHVSAARAILLQEIVRRAQGSRQWLSILHAGACGDDSTCVIFPAESHSGKSTLAAVLMHRGLTFYADDSVAIEKGTLQIPCMPFGLAIREGSWSLISERFPGFLNSPVLNRFGENIRFLYPSSHEDRGDAASMVFSTYRLGAPFSTRRLNTLETLLRLQESGFWVEPQRESVESFLAWLESLPCYELTYDDVDQAGDFISRLLRTPDTTSIRQRRERWRANR